MSKLFTICIVITMFSLQAFGQYADLATEKTSLTLSAAGQNDSATTSLTAVMPMKAINGWAGGFASRQITDGKVTDETMNLHFAGGFVNVVGEAGIEFFVDLDRNKHRNIDFGKTFGYFVRPGIYEVESPLGVIELSGGAGNYTESVDLQEKLGIAAGDPNTFGWLVFTSASIGVVGITGEWRPEINFETYQFTLEAGATKEISDELSVALTLRAINDDKGFNPDSSWDTSYVASLIWGL